MKGTTLSAVTRQSAREDVVEAKPSSEIRFEVPRVPLSPNKELFWAARSRYRAGWRVEVACAVSGAEAAELKTWAGNKQRVAIHIHQYRLRMLDPDNLWAAVKPILDGMRNAGLLWEDHEQAISLSVGQQKVGSRRLEKTEVTVRLA